MCIALQLKTKIKNEICKLNVCCHDIYSGGQEEGTTIPIDSIELTDDPLSQMIAPFEYFFRSRLNCRI